MDFDMSSKPKPTLDIQRGKAQSGIDLYHVPQDLYNLNHLLTMVQLFKVPSEYLEYSGDFVLKSNDAFCIAGSQWRRVDAADQRKNESPTVPANSLLKQGGRWYACSIRWYTEELRWRDDSIRTLARFQFYFPTAAVLLN